MAKAHKSRYAILGILANAPGSSGYDIRSMMQDSTDFFWKETFSSIYPVLEVLEKEKLVTQFELSSSGRKRKTYKITNEGMQVLQKWLVEDVELEQARNEMLLKIFFGDFNSLASSMKHVETYKQGLLEKKLILEVTKKKLPEEYAKERGLPFWMMSVEFGLRRLQASIEWCEYALDKLNKMNKRGDYD